MSVSSDQPALVHPFGTHGLGSEYFTDDHWVISVRNAQGKACGIFDYVYDRAHHCIRFSSYAVLTPSDPQYGHTLPLIPAIVAQAQVQTTRHVALLASAAPQLIFFPLASDWSGSTATHHGTAGGTLPMDPMWLIPGANGQNYFVGTDWQTHTQQDLPIALA